MLISPNPISAIKIKEDEMVWAFNTLAREEHRMHIRRKNWMKGHLGYLDVDGKAVFEV
jgi:hypothetical protein